MGRWRVSSREKQASLLLLMMVLIGGVVVISIFISRRIRNTGSSQDNAADQLQGSLFPSASPVVEQDDDSTTQTTPPTASPSLRAKTKSPSMQPSSPPTTPPTEQPTAQPTTQPTKSPTSPAPTGVPTSAPSKGAAPATDAPTDASTSATLPFEGHIFCYGDSLTAGVSEPGNPEMYPYAPYLEEALTGTYPDFQLVGNIVDHMGLPGYTTQQMLAALDHERFGLVGWMDRSPEDINVLILMTGTNDVLKTNRNATTILERIVALHEIALAHPKVKSTMAIDIPPSGFRIDTPVKNAVAREINKGLRQYASDNERVHHEYFPFPFEDGGENWASDRLHFSRKGHEELGKALADPVRKIVQEQ